MTTTFRIGVTRDFLKADDTLGFGDIGLDLLDESPKVEWEFLAKNTTELRPDQIRGYDGLLVLASTVSAETLQGADKLAIVARFGVGYDSVDVAACNEQGVLLTITPDGVRRPVAVMALTYLLALSHKMLAKDRLVREGRWNERLDYIGMGVTGRTLGLVGLGNIGREICTLAQPFGIRCVAADPFVNAAQARAAGAELVELDQLLQRADYVCICCALTDQTHHLIGERELSLMKESAYLINTARGPIVDQQALTRALQRGRSPVPASTSLKQSLYPKTSRCYHSPTKPSSPRTGFAGPTSASASSAAAPAAASSKWHPVTCPSTSSTPKLPSTPVPKKN